MAININGFPLPDLPEGTLENYTYAAILYVITPDSESFMFVASKSEIMAADDEFVYGIDVGCTFMVTNPSDYITGDYTVGTSEAWENITASSNSSPDYPVTSYLEEEMAITLCWANYDVKWTESKDDSGAYIASATSYPVTPEVVDITVYAEKYVVKTTWIKAIAEQVRRLSGTMNKLSTSAMQTTLSSTKKYTSTSWIAEIENRLDTTNEIATFTSQTEDISVPTGSGISVQLTWNEYSVIADFPEAVKGSQGVFKHNEYLTEFNAPKLLGVPNVMFDDCPSLESVDVPNATAVGDTAFANCVSLTSINLPKTTTIGKLTFAGCSSLEKVDLGVAESIGMMAFSSCTALTAVIIRTPDKVCRLLDVNDSEGDGSQFISAKNVFVYVPSALLAQYKANSVWSLYDTKIRAIEDHPDICGA